MRISRRFLTIGAGLAILAAGAFGKDKKKPKQPQDAIEVVGHVPGIGGAVTGFLPTQHYSSQYLYVEHGAAVTMLDVTRANRPLVLADVAYPPQENASASLFAVAGTAALVTEQRGAADPPAAEDATVRIMDLSDPTHPKVAREFHGVTAMSRDERRGLIFLANSEGVWILHQTFAEDPEVEKQFEHHVLYDH
ncbi:MAG TPA: hypothetical protein VMG40_05490 [Bryobacteraceae bacterium]|nr:hypothetical protein [Bryobacteraceae bacterium]